MIYTDSMQNLSAALNREIEKETPLGAIQDDEREMKEDREQVIKEPPAPQQQQLLPFDHSLDQSPTYPEPAKTQAATFATDIPIEIARERYEPAISTESTQNLQEALDRGVNRALPTYSRDLC